MFSQAPCDEILISFVKMPQQIGLDGCPQCVTLSPPRSFWANSLKIFLPREGWLCRWDHPLKFCTFSFEALWGSPHLKGINCFVFSCRIPPGEWRVRQSGKHRILVPCDPASCFLSWGACSCWNEWWEWERSGTHPVKIGPVLPAEALGAVCFLCTAVSQPEPMLWAWANSKAGAQLSLPLVDEETSHLEVIFSSLSRNPIVRMLPDLIWVWTSWNRLISWGSIQEMFILYFKISFWKKIIKERHVHYKRKRRVQNRLN